MGGEGFGAIRARKHNLENPHLRTMENLEKTPNPWRSGKRFQVRKMQEQVSARAAAPILGSSNGIAEGQMPSEATTQGICSAAFALALAGGGALGMSSGISSGFDSAAFALARESPAKRLTPHAKQNAAK